MDSQLRAILLGSAVVFIVVFGGMTMYALGSATLNFASIMAFGLSFFIVGVALAALIGMIRNPPDDD